MQKKLSNIIRKAAFFMIPIASAICYAGISDDVYASSETTEDSLIYNFRDAKKEGTITFVKRWKDGKKEEDRNIPNIEISTKKPRKNVSGYTVIFHGNGMTFADGSTENEMLFNSSMNIIGGQYKVPGEAYAFWYTEPECINKVNVSSTGIPDLQLDGDINLYARAVTFVTKTGTEFNNAIPDNMTSVIFTDEEMPDGAEIINVDDEYATRRDSAKILSKTLIILIPIMTASIILAHTNYLLLSIILIFEIFMMDSFIDGMVDKIDNTLLKEQLDFFAEIRHAYHEFNMVEEAIYQISQDDEKNISKQGEKIYEVLISNDPEMELEKYYDIAPNPYLKEFAGVSYLTKEFGDRKVDKSSLYLKNVNNITEEMQIEILKRDKIDYVFQSLSIISIVPVLGLEPLKNWSVDNFSFTQNFYCGKGGMLVQILVILLTVICYLLLRKIKNNGSTDKSTQNTENPWQAKVYKNPIGKRIVDLFIPKKGTKDFIKVQKLLKDSASKLKMEWLYVNRITIAILTFLISIFLFVELHITSINWIYTEPTTDYDIMGGVTGSELQEAMAKTESDNKFLDMFRGNTKTTVQDIQKAMERSKDYADSDEEEIETSAKRVYDKLQKVNKEYLGWFEVLLAVVFMIVAYMAPIWIMYFQLKMRQMEMEDEVMQFQTIILMLMRIERVNVEIILEWLERYANIFKEPISRCVNNYEAGAWEALEELKNATNYQQFIRIVESLQAAVEKIPIRDAFDELDSERDYYQAKRRESNDRLIAKKARIGKLIGFTPMVVMFVGYLIVPLVVIGLTSMTSSMASLQ